MDRIILSGIELHAYGGVTEAEREIGQRYQIDLELALDLSAAGRSDNLTDTVSYADVYEAVASALRQRPFRLIEHAAERIAERVLECFPVEAVIVRLRKLLPPIDGVVASAGVEISRERRS